MSENSADVFDLDRIRSLVELMKENGVSEIDLEDNGQRVKLTRGVPGAAGAVAPVAAPAFVETAAPAAPAPAAPAEPESDGRHVLRESPHGQAAVCQSRRRRFARENGLHYRGDEGV